MIKGDIALHVLRGKGGRFRWSLKKGGSKPIAQGHLAGWRTDKEAEEAGRPVFEAMVTRAESVRELSELREAHKRKELALRETHALELKSMKESRDSAQQELDHYRNSAEGCQWRLEEAQGKLSQARKSKDYAWLTTGVLGCLIAALGVFYLSTL